MVLDRYRDRIAIPIRSRSGTQTLQAGSDPVPRSRISPVPHPDPAGIRFGTGFCRIFSQINKPSSQGGARALRLSNTTSTSLKPSRKSLSNGETDLIRYGIGQFIGSDQFFDTRYRKKRDQIAKGDLIPWYCIEMVLDWYRDRIAIPIRSRSGTQTLQAVCLTLRYHPNCKQSDLGFRPGAPEPDLTCPAP
ncbi:hypothetical protein PGT21_024687 [Puccinia graminis f. sp. tritici]|uniref:Uncharacterized protein n=1 Tax=Puccinia graminis f. sp. tritici TaxID=56615 RepID=A0A5B0PRX0_PUCGR|nr:hypothetical protein PGT21_024687 [Puccinia graminis f. sp. tritici]